MVKTVLVTGASGFLAAYCIDEFLKAGWTVRGTVRSAAKSQHILDRYPKGAKLALVEVPDIVTGEGLAEALNGVDAVAHTASPSVGRRSNEGFHSTSSRWYSVSLEGGKGACSSGTLAALKLNRPNRERPPQAAGIKRVVVTSSFAAVTNFTLGALLTLSLSTKTDELSSGGPFRDYTYTSKDWNPSTLENAVEPGRPGAFVYSASKTLAEHAALDYGKESGLQGEPFPQILTVYLKAKLLKSRSRDLEPSHDLYVRPLADRERIADLNQLPIDGPPLQAMHSKSDINTSSNAIYALISGPSEREVPGNRLPLFCNVTDVALAHVKGSFHLQIFLSVDGVSCSAGVLSPGNRLASFLIPSEGNLTLHQLLQAIEYLATARPALASRLPQLPKEAAAPQKIATLDVSPAKELLGMSEFKGWKETLLETIDALVDKEKEWGA
ncbi:hypothetical protein P7C70_g2091, partial [Phenoliferia sp. Uapishka_3]